MISYFVRYEGQADDQDEFVRYYRSGHVPVLLRWPGIRAVHLHVPAFTHDPQPTKSGSVFLMAQLVFDDEEALARALASPQRAEARADMANFPEFNAAVTHQAFQGSVHTPAEFIEEFERSAKEAESDSNLRGG
jgi:uncharacterized protein (TIGR02118 family)